jgi:hypothetical protein
MARSLLIIEALSIPFSRQTLQGCIANVNRNPRFSLRLNLGLKLANAFGVLATPSAY